jgi:hypothetical protein
MNTLTTIDSEILSNVSGGTGSPATKTWQSATGRGAVYQNGNRLRVRADGHEMIFYSVPRKAAPLTRPLNPLPNW